ncbi:MAG TPA: ChbG/HpnK family deacetylase [Fimbriimonadaceae bacterium]|nr:ChbG/HpnK family deacetylase [Fimbriimonadaceae bacterium]HRJ32924.1 ChbG/HpnK family deacetylase [Fimbriimonadaceae bacterium]
MKTIRVILNADDLGMSSHVNQEIFRLMEKGKLTSATLMANGPALEDALRQLPQFPQCSFGVHLNITEFKPVSEHPDLAPLLDEKGEFRKDPHARRTPMTSELKAAILVEYQAQVERIRSLGHSPSHFDSHHHMHTHPPLFSVVKELQKLTQINRVRATQNIYTDQELGGRKLHTLKKWIWNSMMSRGGSTKMTKGFTKFSTFMELAPQGKVFPSTLELMLHPGHEFAEFVQEVNDLEQDWETRWNLRFEKISYLDL